MQDVRSAYDRENKTIVADAENVRRNKAGGGGDDDGADDRPRSGRLIETRLNGWSDTGTAVRRLTDGYEKAAKTLRGYRQLRDETEEWLDGRLLSVAAATASDDGASLPDATKAADERAGRLDELRAMVTDAAGAVGLGPDDAPPDEVGLLSVKLDRVRGALARLGDVAAKKNRLSGDVEDTRRLLHDIEKVRAGFSDSGFSGAGIPTRAFPARKSCVEIRSVGLPIETDRCGVIGRRRSRENRPTNNAGNRSAA